MPRGVYDRSKSKEQRAAEKSGGGAKKAVKAAAAPKRKYTKKAITSAGEAKAVAKQLSSQLKEAAPFQGGIGLALVRDNSYLAMQEVRANIHTLSMLPPGYLELASVKSEVEAQVVALGVLREKAFSEPAQETVSEEVQDEPAEETSEEDEEEAPPVAAQAAPYQGSVPLPPPIVPVPAPVSH